MKTQMKSLAILGMMLAAPTAFAQHGGANGPVTSGALNPASGATAIPVQQIETTEAECYASMLSEMLEPFLNQSQHPSDLNLFTSYAQAHFNFKISPANIAPLAHELYKSGHDHFEAFVYVNKSQEPILAMSLNPSSSSMSQAGLPFISWDGSVMNTYDPITHAETGTQWVATQLKKSYASGVFLTPGNSPPNPEAIPVLNRDGSETNFTVNGKKFFECVESKL